MSQFSHQHFHTTAIIIIINIAVVTITTVVGQDNFTAVNVQMFSFSSLNPFDVCAGWVDKFSLDSQMRCDGFSLDTYLSIYIKCTRWWCTFDSFTCERVTMHKNLFRFLTWFPSYKALFVISNFYVMFHQTFSFMLFVWYFAFDQEFMQTNIEI